MYVYIYIYIYIHIYIYIYTQGSAPEVQRGVARGVGRLEAALDHARHGRAALQVAFFVVFKQRP